MPSFQVLVDGRASAPVGGRRIAFVTTRIVQSETAEAAKSVALGEVQKRMSESGELALTAAQGIALSILEVNPIPLGDEDCYSDTGFVFYDPK